MLGVNAHINYDLVLTLYDMLHSDWDSLSEEDRKSRYQDHCLVNTIIGETIDKVQDEVVEQYSPFMDFVDKMMGRLDEKMLVSLISRWRETVWENTMQLLQCANESEREQLIKQLKKDVFRTAKWLEMEI